MSKYPVSYPITQGSGRSTRVVWLPEHKAEMISSDSVKDAIPSARQILRGRDLTNENGQVMMIDFSQNSDTSELATGDGVISHTIDLPEGDIETSKAGWYLGVGLKTPKAKQAAAVAALDAYFRGIVSCGKFSPIFVHIAISKNDTEMMVIIQGWPTQREGREYYDSEEHMNFGPALADMITISWSWEAELTEMKAHL